MSKSPFIRSISVAAPAVTTAGNSAATSIARAPFAGTVDAVTYTANAAITGAATNNRKLSLINKGQAGAGTTVVATISFASGTNAGAFDETAVAVSSTAANTVIAAGDVLAWASDAVGTGLADPGGLVTITLGRTVGRA